MATTNNVFNLEALSEYTSLLRSDKFLSFLQSRITYDISEIKRQLFNYIEEAEFGVKLLSSLDIEYKRLLEIGSGAGILTCWLLMNKINITGIEPSAIGYNFHNDIYTATLAFFNLPDDHIYDLTAEQLDEAKLGKFNIIFSINVIEHIPPATLELAFLKMRSVLHQDGVMYHHCPNYFIPYDPHYGIPILPFFPHAIAKMKGIYSEGVWQSVNFVTLPDVAKISKKLGLQIDFEKGVMAQTFTRLDTDKEFSNRHPTLTKVYGVMKKTGIMSLIKAIPPVVCTPMTFIMSFSNKA